MRRELLTHRAAGYLGAVFGTSAITLVLAPVQTSINSTTVALTFLLIVLFVALFWGSRPALLAAILSMLSLNFFFLPPLYTFSISHQQNWVALIVFFTTALVVGQLSARAKRRAEEAETGRREIERLYSEFRDAFERASEAEALRRSEKLKSTLLDAVTHDLRTPLASVKASITTLLEEARAPRDVALDAESRLEMMEVIDQESDRLNQFIGDLIELARIEAGELQLRPRWGAIEEIINAALIRAERLTNQHKVEVDIEKELPLVRVDNRAVSEVVYSLIDNAVKYSSAGSLIRISAHPSDDDDVIMCVEDAGRGIPNELRERVFDKFFRAMRDGDTGRDPSGTGMGLAIAKGIIEAHAGRIWIESGREGKGSRVCFTLPIGDEEDEMSDML